MDKTIGKRIAANRKRLGLTQEQLAEQLEQLPLQELISNSLLFHCLSLL